MTKVKPNNPNEAEADIFPWEIFKSDATSFFIKNIKVFQWPSKSKFFDFMTEMNPSNWK